MVAVKIQSMFDFVEIFGQPEVKIDVKENTSIKDLLELLINQYGEKLKEKMIDPKTGDVFEHLEILCNGRNIKFLQGNDTILREGDSVTIFVPIGGGSL